MIFCISMFISLLLILILFILSIFISYKSSVSREKITPFECGFDTLISRRMSFFISFYLFSLIFLVFDVEIVLLLPMIIVMKSMTMNFISLFSIIYFMFLLVLGLYIEWMDSSLDWNM